MKKLFLVLAAVGMLALASSSGNKCAAADETKDPPFRYKYCCSSCSGHYCSDCDGVGLIFCPVCGADCELVVCL